MRDVPPSSCGPIFFERNRVFRVYRGGSLFHEFFGDPDEDSNCPEEWVASTVRAQNKDSKGEDEGISVVRGGGQPFSRMVETRRHDMLGDHSTLDLLVKILHSAVRLPVQVHPDKQFARRHFGSVHGKTEMWLILATRGDARIYVGFKDGVTRRDLARSMKASETDRASCVRLLNEVAVSPGDVFLIPGGLAHTIGAGCLLLEAEEPTDLMIQAEAWCADYHLEASERNMGLDDETALQCFDVDLLVGDRAVAAVRRQPRQITAAPGVSGECLIGRDDTPDFSVNRWRLRTASLTMPNGPSVCVVTEGAGRITGPGAACALRKGDYFFLPACAQGTSLTGSLELVECRPPH